jgi:hypothetical protein
MAEEYAVLLSGGKAAENISIISDSTGPVAFCVETAFYNRLLKER